MTENQINKDETLIAHCGFYCGACPTYTSGKCEGCRGNSPKCAVGVKNCPVKQCCVENGFSTCADCTKFATTDDCKKYNPFSFKFAEWISSMSRKKAIEMIREKGQAEFVSFMANKNWVAVKTKDNFINKSFGKRRNEK